MQNSAPRWIRISSTQSRSSAQRCRIDASRSALPSSTCELRRTDVVADAGSYSASKFALEGMSEASPKSSRLSASKVMIVEPGAFRPNFSAGSLKIHARYGCLRRQSATCAISIATSTVNNVAIPTRRARDRNRARGRNHAAASPGRAGLFGSGAWPREQLLKDLAAWEQVAADTQIVAVALGGRP
jgi:NAD(P)-dependent dehydrogenase (short-subunit alcohol dehydrogenase family)